MNSSLPSPVELLSGLAGLGLDLTDRHARTPRPIDVCALHEAPRGTLRASFWSWTWTPADEGEVDLSPVLPELKAAPAIGIDGPQGLAAPGRSLRSSERETAAAGKTPDQLPPPGKPYSGFIRSSIELFAALDGEGLPISPESPAGGTFPAGGIFEVYPGHAWKALAGARLPRKTTPEGVQRRRELLEAVGIQLPASGAATHDQLDAALCALVAMAACSPPEQLSGLRARRLGEPLLRDSGQLREGPILSLEPRADPGQSRPPAP